MGIQPIRKTVTPEIPDKLYFRIGDVARICEVPAYVLRFWETEFPQLKPNKGGTGQRLYRKRDVEMALRIKSLLYDQGYTIPGARGVFKAEAKAREVTAEPFATPETLAAPDALPVPGSSTAATPAGSALPLAASSAALPAAAALAPHTTSAAQQASDYDAGAEVRRQVKLHGLRAEMQALLEYLQKPVNGAAKLPSAPALTLLAPQPVQGGPAPQATPFRPRLLVEPRPAAPKAEPLRPETLRLVPLAPRELPQVE